MALNIFSMPSLRTFGSNLGSLSTCRWNSTASTSASAFQRAANSNQSPRFLQRRRLPNRQKFLEDQKAQGESRALEKFQTRDWKAGDIYSPNDLSPSEMRKWKKLQPPPKDAFDGLNMNPLDLYKNVSIMSEYMTTMGRIRHRSKTGLRPVNQRKIAKAIRRAIGVGLMPSVHRHPEILAAEAKARMNGGIY